MPIRATGDLVQHVLHGMNGAVLVMPKDAEVTESGIERRVDGFAGRHDYAPVRSVCANQIARSAIIFLVSAMARAGFNPLGHTLAQFMMVWQR